eukprot:1700164-Amphidinium_carterae.1
MGSLVSKFWHYNGQPCMQWTDTGIKCDNPQTRTQQCATPFQQAQADEQWDSNYNDSSYSAKRQRCAIAIVSSRRMGASATESGCLTTRTMRIHGTALAGPRAQALEVPMTNAKMRLQVPLHHNFEMTI